MTTKTRLPKALEREPIVSATFEVRFESDTEGLADLLPGLLYPHLKNLYDRVETLPSSEIPKVLREKLPNAPYQGLRRLAGKGTTLTIAERGIVVEVTRPYGGWKRFSALIFDVIAAVEKTGLVGAIERTSLRYQNILETHENPNDFSGLNLVVNVSYFHLRDGGFNLRLEVERDECVSIINVAGSANAVISINDEKTSISGLLVDIDTIRYAPLPTFWTDYRNIIESVHDAEKNVFFALLKAETISQLGAVWE